MNKSKSPTRIFQELEETQGSNAKIDFIRQHENNDVFIEALRLAADPRVVFNMTSASVYAPNTSPFRIDDDSRQWEFFNKMLLLMNDIDAHKPDKRAFDCFFAGQSAEASGMMLRVLDKNLRMGVSYKSVNKAIPGLIRTFNVALCAPFAGRYYAPGRWCTEPKYDGVRGICDVGGDAMYSRRGIQLHNTHDVLWQCRHIFPQDVYLDGELVDRNWNQTVSTLHTQEKQVSELIYYVFDIIPRDEWEAKRSTSSLRERKKVLDYHFSNIHAWRANVQQVPCIPVTDPDSIYKALSKYESVGLEGVVVKDMSKPYQFKRSTSWQKLKNFQSAEFVIIDIKEGEGKYEDTLGAICIIREGCSTWVGSGFTDEERDDMWNMPNLVGRMAEIKYQSVTVAGALLFPTFLRLRGDL